MFDFLSLQKRLSSTNDFYFSSVTTTKTFSKSLKTNRQEMRETIVVLKFDERFLIQFLEKTTNETDIASYKWLLIISNLTLQDFAKLRIPLNAEFIIAHEGGHSVYNLSEIYDIQPGKKLTKVLGQWFDGVKFNMNAISDVFERRRNLEGALIKVISPRKDNCMETTFATGVANIVWCIHQKVWGVMAEMLNATTEVLIVPNLTPVTIQKIPDAELTFRSAPLNAPDLNTRSYVWPIFSVMVEVVTSYIGDQIELRTYILPFSTGMWMAVLLWLIVCDPMLALFEFVAQKKKNKNSFLGHCKEFSFVTTFAFCSQGVVNTSKFASSRIILLMMFLVPGVIFPGYSAVFTSFLTVQVQTKPFRNLEELSRTKYKLGWHNTFALEHMFNMKDTSPLNQALLKNNVLPPEKLPATDVEGIERMCNEKFAFLTITDTILALKPKCRYYKLKQHFKIVFTSIETKKNSWYKYHMDRCERTLDFTGILYRMKLQVVMKYVKYKQSEIVYTGEVPPIKIENIVLPFAVLLFGGICSVFFLILERICFKPKLTDSRCP